MKKITAPAIALIFALMCACGSAQTEENAALQPENVPVQTVSTQAPSPEPEVSPLESETPLPEVSEELPVETVEVTAEVTAEPEDEEADDESESGGEQPDEDEPSPEPVSDELSPGEKKFAAQQLIGSSVSALYDAIGYPLSSEYAESALDDGEDGNLYYEGFTVYTFRNADDEIINYVD